LANDASANETYPSLLTSALQVLDASNDGDFAGVLEHKKHWKAFTSIYGLGEPESFDAKQIASQHELGIGWDAQALDFMPIFVKYDKFLREA